MLGNLILNGRIYGNDERSTVQQDIQRGWWMYCSKRRKNGKGCGKSYSLFFHTFIKGFTIQANSLWRFLKNISIGMNKHKAKGITGVDNSSRSDKGKTRKITPEELLEAINQVLPYFREKHYNKSDIYRVCIEKGTLHKNQIAPTTFYRFVKEYELLKKDVSDNKKRLAFSMQYANQLWQADTMYGPYVKHENGKAGADKTYCLSG